MGVRNIALRDLHLHEDLDGRKWLVRRWVDKSITGKEITYKSPAGGERGLGSVERGGGQVAGLGHQELTKLTLRAIGDT